MFETRPNAVLSFGDMKVELPKEVVDMLEKVVLEDAIKKQNFDAYDLAKGVHEVSVTMRNWKPKDVPVESDWVEITFDLRTLENTGNEIPNIFALLNEQKPLQREFYGEVVDAARIVSVSSTISSEVSVASQVNCEFIPGQEGTRCMRAQWEADYNGKDYLLSIVMNGQTGLVKFCRNGDIDQVTLAFRRTWVRSNIQIGKLNMTQQELTYLAENPDVRKELDGLIDRANADKPTVADVGIQDIDFEAVEGNTGHFFGQGSYAVTRSVRAIKPVKINGLPIDSLLTITEDPTWHPGSALMKEGKAVLVVELVGKNTDIIKFVRDEWVKSATFEIEYFSDTYRL